MNISRLHKIFNRIMQANKPQFDRSQNRVLCKKNLASSCIFHTSQKLSIVIEIAFAGSLYKQIKFNL